MGATADTQMITSIRIEDRALHRMCQDSSGDTHWLLPIRRCDTAIAIVEPTQVQQRGGILVASLLKRYTPSVMQLSETFGVVGWVSIWVDCKSGLVFHQMSWLGGRSAAASYYSEPCSV